MSGTFGKKINLSIFGESHGEAIGIVISGIPAGIKIDKDKIDLDMKRRRPGVNSLSTPRNEADEIIYQSGIFDGFTTGSPISIIIKNKDTKSKDYSKTMNLVRPSHGDYSGFVKYDGFNDYRGGGHFSGRITAPLVFAGSVAKQILANYGIFIGSHILQVGNVVDDKFDLVTVCKNNFDNLLEKELPVINDEKIELMKAEILNAKSQCDSVGGIIECAITGVVAGVGDPFFDSIESTIAHLAFSIPAVKGIEFGAGFDFATMNGSIANDEFYIDDGQIKTFTNNNGGINGGISNGMPIVFRTVFKPTPSIGKTQRTVNIETMTNETIVIEGRHDPCIVQRGLVVVEAIGALSILELL